MYKKNMIKISKDTLDYCMMKYHFRLSKLKNNFIKVCWHLRCIFRTSTLIIYFHTNFHLLFSSLKCYKWWLDLAVKMYLEVKERTMLMRWCSPNRWEVLNLTKSIQGLTCSHWGTEPQCRDLHQSHILCRWWWGSRTCRQSTPRGRVGGTGQSLGPDRCWPGLQSEDRQDFCCHSAHLRDKGWVKSNHSDTAVLKVY